MGVSAYTFTVALYLGIRVDLTASTIAQLPKENFAKAPEESGTQQQQQEQRFNDKANINQLNIRAALFIISIRHSGDNYYVNKRAISETL